MNELVSSGDIGQEMLGRHGYVYSIRLDGTAIAASARPLPGEQPAALYNNLFGPALAPLCEASSKPLIRLLQLFFEVTAKNAAAS